MTRPVVAVNDLERGIELLGEAGGGDCALVKGFGAERALAAIDLTIGPAVASRIGRETLSRGGVGRMAESGILRDCAGSWCDAVAGAEVYGRGGRASGGGAFALDCEQPCHVELWLDC